MTSEPTEPAAAVFEIVLEATSTPQARWRSALGSLVRVFSNSPAPEDEGGAIISVRRLDTGDEIFRHIEELDDDEDHLLHGLRQDLAAMTAAEFGRRWGTGTER